MSCLADRSSDAQTDFEQPIAVGRNEGVREHYDLIENAQDALVSFASLSTCHERTLTACNRKQWAGPNLFAEEEPYWPGVEVLHSRCSVAALGADLRNPVFVPLGAPILNMLDDVPVTYDVDTETFWIQSHVLARELADVLYCSNGA